MIDVRWSVRAEPAVPSAVVGRGAAARRLGARLMSAGTGWRGLVGSGRAQDDLLLVFADSRDLPWVDGLTWLAADPAAPALWVDTRFAPDLPWALVARAVRRVVPGAVAWLRDPDLLVPLGAADRIDPAALGAWLTR